MTGSQGQHASRGCKVSLQTRYGNILEYLATLRVIDERHFSFSTVSLQSQLGACVFDWDM